MDLYPGLAPYALTFLGLAVVAAVVSLAVVADVVVRNRRDRLARHESIPTYYRALVLSH